MEARSQPDPIAEPEGGTADDARFARRIRVAWLGGPEPQYWLTRALFLRGVGFVYAVAFAVACAQWRGLIGSRGLLPAERFVERIRDDVSFLELPSLLRFGASDGALLALCWLGLGLFHRVEQRRVGVVAPQTRRDLPASGERRKRGTPRVPAIV